MLVKLFHAATDKTPCGLNCVQFRFLQSLDEYFCALNRSRYSTLQSEILDGLYRFCVHVTLLFHSPLTETYFPTLAFCLAVSSLSSAFALKPSVSFSNAFSKVERRSFVCSLVHVARQ